MIGFAASLALGVVICACCIAALLKRDSWMGPLDRLFLATFAGTMLLTTPSLFFPTPFDAWAFVLSRACLCWIVLRRYGLPLFWEYSGDARQRRQNDESRRRRVLDTKLHDRMGDGF